MSSLLIDTTIGVSKWIIDYLEIPNYLYIKSKGLVEGEKIYDSEEHYWNDLLGPAFHSRRLKNPRIHEGDVVVLKNFQLSPWFPRVPGLYWTSYGNRLRRQTEGKETYSHALGFHYEPYHKGQMVHGGLGTVRTEKSEALRLYGATSGGNLNASIPILISNKVSKNIIRFTKKYPLIEVDLRGVIQRIPFTYQSLHRYEHIPRLCLYVNSFLNVNKYISNFSLSASAWTIYCSPNARNEKRYGYTYANFNPIDESSIIKATDWLHSYIDEYTNGKGIPITDFDEVTPRFKTAVASLQDVMQGNINYEALNDLFKGIDFRKQDVLVR